MVLCGNKPYIQPMLTDWYLRCKILQNSILRRQWVGGWLYNELNAGDTKKLTVCEILRRIMQIYQS